MERDSGVFGADWLQLSADVLVGMQDWRAQHPRATLTEIEVELDRRLAGARARLLEHLAQQGQAAAWSRQPTAGTAGTGEPPRCPACGTPLEARGYKTRRLKTQGGRELAVRREYGVCPQCGQGLFPPG
jgi:YgiT-type zinc finger domain-containing protein